MRTHIPHRVRPRFASGSAPIELEQSTQALVADDLVFVYAGSHDKRGYAVRVGENPSKVLWRYDKGTAYVASGVLYDGSIYLITDSDDGRILRLKPRSGP